VTAKRRPDVEVLSECPFYRSGDKPGSDTCLSRGEAIVISARYVEAYCKTEQHVVCSLYIHADEDLKRQLLSERRRAAAAVVEGALSEQPAGATEEAVATTTETDERPAAEKSEPPALVTAAQGEIEVPEPTTNSSPQPAPVLGEAAMSGAAGPGTLRWEDVPIIDAEPVSELIHGQADQYLIVDAEPIGSSATIHEHGRLPRPSGPAAGLQGSEKGTGATT
jgi:hypothetical protein